MTAKSETKEIILEKYKTYDIPLDQLIVDENQPRKHFDEKELEFLKQSIEEIELLNPVTYFINDNKNSLSLSAPLIKFD